MVARIQTIAFQGIEAVPVDVQVIITPGKKNIHIVGLPDKAVAESRERVQAALHASGLSLPAKKVIVNLAPADLPKEGSHLIIPSPVIAGARDGGNSYNSPRTHYSTTLRHHLPEFFQACELRQLREWTPLGRQHEQGQDRTRLANHRPLASHGNRRQHSNDVSPKANRHPACARGSRTASTGTETCR
jgi:Subunit ChlI of Mg-chelatase